MAEIPQGFRRRSVQIVIRIASGRVAAALSGMALGSGHELDSSLDALMPAADFSEFSYGYAVVPEAEDLLTTLAAGLVSAPTLPSLIKENTVGYDAHPVSVDFALFLQFKRSFFVSRQHTSGACGYIGPEPHCTWAFWNTEHYRFDVDMSSNQFHAMRGYETDIALAYRAGLSLYAAPAFHREAELNDSYTRSAILDRSVGVLPSAFDTATPPPGEHKYSFPPNDGCQRDYLGSDRSAVVDAAEFHHGRSPAHPCRSAPRPPLADIVGVVGC